MSGNITSVFGWDFAPQGTLNDGQKPVSQSLSPSLSCEDLEVFF